MKNTYGTSVAMTVFGESHGSGVGVVLDGLCPGIEVDEEEIKRALSRRAPSTGQDTARREKDEFKILSGVFNGYTTGTPLCIFIPNDDVDSSSYSYGVARPSHADYAAYCKYHGYEDYRGGGHFSGRVTAGIVAAGAVLNRALRQLGVNLSTHILECAGVKDKPFSSVGKEIESLSGANFPVIDSEIGREMIEKIDRARSDGDSVGGVTETAVAGMPSGLGEPMFDSIEGALSRALFAIGGIKGIEFGDAFTRAAMRGSESNDPLRMTDGRVHTLTNHDGGINGGITNGEPIIFRCAVKPTPSISREQLSVDFRLGQDETLNVRGRHDPAIVRRICPVIDAVTSLVICDMLALRYGTDVFVKGVK